MPSKDPYPEYSEQEIRFLIKKKIFAFRWNRVKRYEATGRAYRLSTDLPQQELQNFRSSHLAAMDESKVIPPKGRPVWGKLLLFVEFSAVLGLIFAVLVGFTSFRGLNRDVANTFTMPSLTPTPLVRAVVLPSGHVPPTLSGETSPNEAEIPAHLRPIAQAYSFIPTPTPGVEQGIRIQIPAIDVDAPIVQGDGWEQLKKGVGQHIGTANPGQIGNMVLTGHNDVFGEVFRYLDRLKPGDEITIFTARRSYVYTITEWFLVDPSQVEVMAPSPSPTITLISCYPYMINTQRIIVKGILSS
jgi:sortase A